MGVGSEYIHTWMCRYNMGNSIIYDCITIQFIKGLYNREYPKMSKMSYIHYLCEKQDLKNLTEEVGSDIVAQQFLDAHNNMRENRGNKEYDTLNEIADKSIEEYEANPEKVKEEGKSARQELNRILTDIVRPN